MRAVLQPARVSETQGRRCMIQGATGGHIELFETSAMVSRDRQIHNAFFEQPLERSDYCFGRASWSGPNQTRG